jgi:hypothetical protein
VKTARGYKHITADIYYQEYYDPPSFAFPDEGMYCPVTTAYYPRSCGKYQQNVIKTPSEIVKLTY